MIQLGASSHAVASYRDTFRLLLQFASARLKRAPCNLGIEKLGVARILFVAAQTGLRNNEITFLRCRDVELGSGAHVRCLGKGRKMRCTPLRPDVVALSADAFQRLVARHLGAACEVCPSLMGRKVIPRTSRHTAAMNLLRAGRPSARFPRQPLPADRQPILSVDCFRSAGT